MLTPDRLAEIRRIAEVAAGGHVGDALADLLAEVERHRSMGAIQAVQAEARRLLAENARLTRQLGECHDTFKEIVQHSYGPETSGLRTICAALLRKHGQLK
jgi:hypothetical protein